VTVLRAVQDRDPIDRCTTPMHALVGWSAEEINALLAALPLAAALPARHTLDARAQTAWRSGRRHAGEIPATVLRSHGRIFADIVGALADDARSAVLPRLNDPHVGSALDDLAVADTLVAHYLSHALHANDSIAAYNAPTAASLEETRCIRQFLPNALRQPVRGDCDALLTDVAAPGRADDLAQALRGWNANDPPALSALRLLIDDNPDGTARAWQCRRSVPTWRRRSSRFCARICMRCRRVTRIVLSPGTIRILPRPYSLTQATRADV
jgi:hypothetical protein